jgi:hypothetical protein
MSHKTTIREQTTGTIIKTEVVMTIETIEATATTITEATAIAITTNINDKRLLIYIQLKIYQ